MKPEVIAEVKQVLYHWWNATQPVEHADHFGVTAQVLIGSAEGGEADSSDGILCSPSMFAEKFSVEQWGSAFTENVLPSGAVLPVHEVWLMRAWSPAAFESAVERLVVACSPGPDWGTVADRIGRLLPWEYDYRHDDRVNQRAGLPKLQRSFWHDEYRP